MRFRKFALRGIIILAVVIALCVLFSGTIRSLTTPKVRYAPVKQGKFESVTELSGKVVFPEEEEIVLQVPEDATLTVTKVFVSAGKKVKQGEKLLTAEVTDLEKKLAALRQEYESAQDTLDAWERKNSSLRLTRNEQLWMESWEAARAAEQAEREARITLLALLKADTVPETLPEGAEAETREAFAAWQKTAEEASSARGKLRQLDRYAIPEETWTLLQSRQEAEQKKADAETRMMALMRLSRETETVSASHAGYITEVSVEKGGVLSDAAVVMKITAEGQDPVIRADVSELKQSIKKGTAISVPSEPWGAAETKVVNVGLTPSGHPFVDAEISQDVVYTLGQVEDMLKLESITLRLSLKAQDSTCLVPAAAVRGGGDGRYVYVGEQHQSAFEGNTIRVQKMNVTVLAESASTVSVAEDLSYTKVLYMEDRAIEEGGTVMLYEE